MSNQKTPQLRLKNQQISQSALASPAEVVGWMGAMQGQDYAGAKWSIGLRLPGSTDETIEQAIASRSIVRTWILRGTLHFVAAADLRWMLALIEPRSLSARTARYRELELDGATFTSSLEIISRAVQDGASLTRKELFALLEQHGISTAGQRGIHILQEASFQGLLCQTTTLRGDPYFIALDASFPQPHLAREEAVAKLAQTYIRSHGPATVQDFAWWSSLTIGDARAGFAAVEREFAQFSIDGKSYWHLPEQAISPARSTYLLPGFDEYLLGYKNRELVLDPLYSQRIVPGGNGMFMSTIVYDGQVVGIWKRTIKKDRIVIALEPFPTLNQPSLNELTEAAEAYGSFLQLPVAIES